MSIKYSFATSPIPLCRLLCFLICSLHMRVDWWNIASSNTNQKIEFWDYITNCWETGLYWQEHEYKPVRLLLLLRPLLPFIFFSDVLVPWMALLLVVIIPKVIALLSGRSAVSLRGTSTRTCRRRITGSCSAKFTDTSQKLQRRRKMP